MLQDPVNGGITGRPSSTTAASSTSPSSRRPARTIDLATITDAAPEFDLVGPSTLTIDATQAPVLVSRVGQTWTFRYWTLGSLASGQSLTVRFKTTDAATGFAYTDGTVNTFEGPVAPVNLTVGSTTTPNVSWIDLLINPAAGDQLIASSITSSALHLAGAGATGVQLAPIAPMQIAGTSIWRFFVLGSFGAGGVTLDIDANRFASNPTGDASLPKVVNAAGHQGFTVQLLTGGLAGGLSGALIGTDQLNDRGWIDVTFTAPGLRRHARPELGARPRARVHGHAVDRHVRAQRRGARPDVAGPGDEVLRSSATSSPAPRPAR